MHNSVTDNYSKHAQIYRFVMGDGSDALDVVLGRLLFALRFKNKLIGTNYLKEAIVARLQLPQHARVSLTRQVYSRVAEKLCSTVDRVERAIRNAIVDCHNHGSLLALNDLIQCNVVSKTYVPTNGEFISNVVSWLCLERDKKVAASRPQA